ncbi:MAG TPA: FliH/SctL family protein [Xanthobacteraceae bacterium]|jgi:flagellar assembly protein FliH|nr:FliH/SctL family protein [Xanthobacteraceae bacterium]
MAAPAKFLFDQDFAPNAEVKPTVALAAHEAKLKEAETAGYRRGYAAAKAEIIAEAEQRSAAALQRVAGKLEEVARGLSGVEARLETEAVDVAVAVAKKLAAALIQREPLAEIAALATDCFRNLVAAPHVVVRVSEAQQATVAKPIEDLVRARGLNAHLVVLAEPGIQIGDCRIEWADGGVNRDRAAIEATIDEAVSRYVKARLATAAP